MPSAFAASSPSPSLPELALNELNASSNGSPDPSPEVEETATLLTHKPTSIRSITGEMNSAGGKPEQKGDFRAAGLYMLISILLIFFNKATFSYYDFAAPNVLTLSQNVCSLVFLLVCKQMRLVEFHDFSMRNFRKMLPLGLTFIAYMVFGMIAMKVVNIPMYTTLRRTTVVFVMLLEWLISRKTSSLTVKFSVGFMILGAMVAGVRDLNFDLVAYLLVVFYNVCTALYLVLINHISAGEKSAPAGQKLDKYDFMFYNNLISIPMLIVIIAVTGETEAARDSPFWADTGFLVSLAASSMLAFALNYTIFWNTAVNSALTQTVSGQAKDVVVVLLGFVLFDDAHFDPINILGVTIGFGGSILYAVNKILPSVSVEPILARLGFAMTDHRHALPFTSEHASPRDNGDEGSHRSLLPHRPLQHIHSKGLSVSDPNSNPNSASPSPSSFLSPDQPHARTRQ